MPPVTLTVPGPHNDTLLWSMALKAERPVFNLILLFMAAPTGEVNTDSAASFPYGVLAAMKQPAQPGLESSKQGRSLRAAAPGRGLSCAQQHLSPYMGEQWLTGCLVMSPFASS